MHLRKEDVLEGSSFGFLCVRVEEKRGLISTCSVGSEHLVDHVETWCEKNDEFAKSDYLLCVLNLR